MIPVVTPDEMRAIDAAAPETVEELIGRAGAAVAREAIDLLGGSYGRVVNVIAGPGNNGADGRDAANRLRRRGITVRVFEVGECPVVLPAADLVIDAAFGTGYQLDSTRRWTPPDIGDAMILAVDIPSGIDGSTGATGGSVLNADRTVVFQALKPGLLFGAGPSAVGEVVVVDIGLDTSAIRCGLVERSDVIGWWPTRRADAHKWNAAVKVIAGSDAMPGAAELCTAAAMRSGSGLVSLSSPGCRPQTRSEVVQRPISTSDFAIDALSDIERFRSLVIGPGLGRADEVLRSVCDAIRSAPIPVVIDGDALFALSSGSDDVRSILNGRTDTTLLTPHDGEFEVLTGTPPGADRIASCRAVAAAFDAHVLLKGPTTVIAAPPESSSDQPGSVVLVDHGDERLATAGTGDVLAGVIGAAIAMTDGGVAGESGGLDPVFAAAAAAWVHAEAALLGPAVGLLAGDIVELLPEALGSLRGFEPW